MLDGLSRSCCVTTCIGQNKHAQETCSERSCCSAARRPGENQRYVRCPPRILSFVLANCSPHLRSPRDKRYLQSFRVQRRFQLVEWQISLTRHALSGGGIRITDELYRLREQLQFANLPNEVEARWRLVETAWELDLPSSLIVACNPEQDSITTVLRNRRVSVTRCRDALNGYQKGKCFYCFADVRITGALPDSADVDHFFPHVLGRLGLQYAWNGVWNLVLACRSCNRGVDGKSSRLPELAYLERLHARNEFFIGSHHPLRETLIAQPVATSDRELPF